jgi:histidine triad (HIT) family protein
MPLNEKEVQELKEQLKQQVQNLPPQQKQLAEQQIDTMSPEAIETMVEQQKSQQVQIFRQIAKKEVPSAIVAENAQALAVLELRPLSKGHTIIIPSKPVTDPKALPKEANDLAQEVITKIKEHFKAKTVHQQTEVKFGEAIIDLIPEYDAPINPTTERKQADPKELESLAKQLNQEIIKAKPKPKIIKAPTKKPMEVLKLKRNTP